MRARRLAALAAILLLASSCGQSGTSRSEPTSPRRSTGTPATASANGSPRTSGAKLQPLRVHIRHFAYVPAAPVVIVGQRIEIVNDDPAAHTWSAAPGAGWSYTSGNLEKGQRAAFPGLTRPGRYKFLCYYHAEMPSMTGVMTVKAAP